MSWSGKADVLVIGAGPAGAACAIQAASAGLRVMLVAPEPGRERPGETLHPGVEPVFDRLGMREAVLGAGWLRHSGHRIGPGGRLAAYGNDAHGPWRGFQAPSAELDLLLLERARAAGAALLTGAAKALLVARAGPTLKVAGARVGDTEIGATVTVDASGPARFAAKALGLPKHRDGPARRVYWGHVARPPAWLQQEPYFQVLPSGWLWQAPIHASLCAWVWGPHAETPFLTSAIGRELAKSLGTDDIGRARGAAASSTLVHPPRPCTGLLLAGDAAFSVSPIAGKGVLRALLMGIAAAEAARRIVTQSGCPARIVASHAAWTAQWFARESAAVTALHPAMPAQ